MSTVNDAIRERRSIRKYRPLPISEEVINEVLTAAGWAPSAHNAQPWRFVVLNEPSIKSELAEAMAETWAKDMAKDGLNIDSEMRKTRIERFASAPVLILACLTMDGMNRFPDEERRNIERDLAMQSLGASMQNMLLAAHTKGLGACWFCAPGFCKQTVRRTLKIPAEIEPEALIALGYPAEKPPTPTRKIISEYSFKDKWGKKLN